MLVLAFSTRTATLPGWQFANRRPDWGGALETTTMHRAVVLINFSRIFMQEITYDDSLKFIF